MTHLQIIQTTNHVSPNIHENPKLQINKHKVMILSKICNLNRKSRLITPEANKPQEPTSSGISYGLEVFSKLSCQQFITQISHLV